MISTTQVLKMAKNKAKTAIKNHVTHKDET